MSSVDLMTLAQRGPIHFMGIGGAGMSALADALIRSGARVTGCDLHATAAQTLLGDRVDVSAQHDPAHIDDAAAVVVTSAVPQSHPELQAARARGIPVMKRAEALGAFVNTGNVLAVAGTHGKTTTTAMLTGILDAADLDPTAFVGGRVQAWGGGLRSGASRLYVVEADEYDRSFLTLYPNAVAVTSVEADHLDIYGTIEAIYEAFRELLERVPADGLIALCADDEGASSLLPAGDARVVRYGTRSYADLRAVDVSQSGSNARFTVYERDVALGPVTLGVPGLHNVRNGLAAIALARHAGASFEAVQRALPGFRGVARRFEVVGTARGVTFVDDYAHHPTEIAATLAAARSVYPGQRIIAVFQPHLYSRTRDLAVEFGYALAQADAVWVTDVYAAREAVIEGVSGELIVNAAKRAGADGVHYAPTLDVLQGELAQVLVDGDVCIAMGAGDIDTAIRSVYARFAEGE